MPRTKRTVAHSILLHALAKYGAKEGDREILCPGGHDVDVTVCGQAGGVQLEQRIVGMLNVGGDTQAASNVAVDRHELLACILDKLEPAGRDKLLTSLVAHFEEHGSLPRVAHSVIEQAARLNQRLNTRVMSERKGPVSFVVTAAK